MTSPLSDILFFFFFNDTATTEIYTLSLHDALPISMILWALTRTLGSKAAPVPVTSAPPWMKIQTGSPSSSPSERTGVVDRKSTRLNSSHANISYAVFCLKKKNKNAEYRRFVHIHIH